MSGLWSFIFLVVARSLSSNPPKYQSQNRDYRGQFPVGRLYAHGPQDENISECHNRGRAKDK